MNYNQINNISYLSKLREVHHLALSGNYIRDISVLSELTNLHTFSSKNNKIRNLFALIENKGLFGEDFIWIANNPLDTLSLEKYIPKLIERGVFISY